MLMGARGDGDRDGDDVPVIVSAAELEAAGIDVM